MTTTLRRSALVLVLASLLPAAAHAHRQWLLPSASNVEGREPWVTVDAAISANLFDVDGFGLPLDGLTITAPDGSAVQPDNILKGHQRNTIELRLRQHGTYKIALVGERVMASYMLNGEHKRFRGSAEEFAEQVPANAGDVRKMVVYGRNETFVTEGRPTDTVLKPSNVGLEMIPLTPPTELRAGEKAAFRFLIDGKPAARLGFSLIPGGVRYRGVLHEIRLVTDARGEASLTWPAAGMYWVSASWPERAPRVEGQPPPPPPAHSLTYSATLEVLPQ